MQKRLIKAQTILTYVVLIAVMVGVIIAMRIFLVRAIQAKFRESADAIGQGEQYEKGKTEVIDSY